MLLLNKIEKEQIKLNISRRKKIIKIEAEINKTENGKPTEKIIKPNAVGFFGTFNKIDKPLCSLMNKKIEKKQIINIRKER